MDAKTQEILRKVLKDSGHSLTTARLFVAELLWQQPPLTMRELSSQLGGTIDRASLYRTIGLFEQLGLVQRIYIGWKYKVELSDVLTHHHHHISCLGCGKIVAMTEEDELERLIEQAARRHGFTPTQHQLEVSGYCERCMTKRLAANKDVGATASTATPKE